MRLTRLRLALLLTAAFVAAFGGSICPASADDPAGAEIPPLVASGHWTVRFRANDHGALRALRTVYASGNVPLWVVGGRPTPTALAMVRTLQQADVYGLEPQDYDADGLAALATRALGAG